MKLFQEVGQFLVTGGPAMIPLGATAFALWYAIGNRFFLLRRKSSVEPRELMARIRGGKSVPGRDPVAIAAVRISGLLESGISGEAISFHAEEIFNGIKNTVKRYRKAILTLVVIAPLLGLLGTVMGMIEAFDSITQSASADTSSGIASGIAKALFATQLGLVVAIPGMIMGNLLTRKEKKILAEIRQVRSLVASRLEGIPCE